MKISPSLVAVLLSASALVAQCPRGLSYGGGDDFVANGGAGIPLGFTFPLNGVSYTHVHPCSNGYTYLSDGSAAITDTDFSPTLAEFANDAPRVAPFWDDLNLVAANGGELFVDTSPTECRITWSNAVNYNTTTPVFSFSVTLYPGGDVHFGYDDLITNNGQTFVGVSPGNGALQAASVDLTTSPVGVDPMFFEDFAAAGAFDLAGSLTIIVPSPPTFAAAFVAGGAEQCATSAEYGVGCGTPAPGDVAHELMPQGGWDISNTVTFLRSGGSYTIVDVIPGTFLPPSAGATVVSTVDDGYGSVQLSAPMPVPGGFTSTLTICTNGFVSLSAQQPIALPAYDPDVADFEGFTAPAIAAPWYDWSPNNGGQLVFEEIGGIAYVTWDNVPAYGTTVGDTFQYQFEVATGNCTVVYQTMNMAGTSAWHTPLFGVTTGSTSFLSTAYDFSVDLAQTIQVNDPVTAMRLTGNAPKVGGTFDMITSGIDPVSPISILMFSDARLDPGVLLPSVGLDAPGCSVYLPSILGTLTGTNSGGSSIVQWVLPPTASSYLGLVVATQSVCLTTQNGLGLLTSNGYEGVLGY